MPGMPCQIRAVPRCHVPCRASPCHASSVPCQLHAMPCRASSMPCHSVPCRAVPAPCHANFVPCRAMPISPCPRARAVPRASCFCGNSLYFSCLEQNVLHYLNRSYYVFVFHFFLLLRKNNLSEVYTIFLWSIFPLFEQKPILQKCILFFCGAFFDFFKKNSLKK